MTTRARIAVLAAVVVVAVVGFVIAAGGGGDSGSSSDTETTTASTATETTTTTQAGPAGPPLHRIRVVGGKPQGGVQPIEVKKGDIIRLAVTSDVTDEIHVHGYDVKKDVGAGGTARLRFQATIDGGFEIELENHGEQIAALTVEP